MTFPRDETNPAYQLMPEKIAKDIPKLYETEKVKDPIAHVKLFTPDSNWTWLIVEADPAERLCFGLVIGHERELGYFSLRELEEVRGPLGLPIERDLHWQPIAVSKCR